MTLRTRDHEDIIDSNLAYHLSAGVDFVIATDHRSVDGTREILRRYAGEGILELVCKDDETYVPGEWINDMARHAWLAHGADWVIAADPDEFWWPSGGDLKDVLAAIPARYGALLCPWRHFVPRPDASSHFAERMTLRIDATGPWTRPEDPFHPNVNVTHRAGESVRLRPGNHDVESPFPVLRGWFPIEVLHFPLRTLGQAEAKFAAWGQRETLEGMAPHVDTAGEAIEAERFGDYYRRYVVDDAAAEDWIADGTLAVDVRVRDALRALAGDTRRELTPETVFPPNRESSQRLTFARRGVSAAASLAGDVSVLPDPGARLEHRVAGFERRLVALERRRWAMRRPRGPARRRA